MPEAIVVGAGVVGTSIAFHLAEKGVDTLVVVHLARGGRGAGPEFSAFFHRRI